MKEIKCFCDICGKQFPDNLQEFSQFTGAIIKLDAKMNPNQLRFSADYCDTCTKSVLEFIDKLHESTRATDSGDKLNSESDSGSKQD